MRVIIQDISEMTDSRELLQSKPYPFITIFIYIIISILSSALIWSYFSEIDIVIKANGIVRPNEKVSTITNNTTGTVDNVYFENGQKIKKGDLLYIINHDGIALQLEGFENSFNRKQNELENLIKFKNSILDGISYFDQPTDEQNDYYYKYEKYMMDLDKVREDASLTMVQIKNTNEKVTNLKTLLSSIENEQSLFDDQNNIYAMRFRDYELKLKEFNNLLNQSQYAYEAYSILREAGAISKNDFDKTKNTYESTILNLESFKNETLLQIKSDIELNKKQLEEYESELRKAAAKRDYGVLSKEDIIMHFKTESLIEVNENIQALEDEIDTLQENIDTNKLNIENCVIRSPIDGFINVHTDINKGDNILSGIKILTIIPSNRTQYKVQLYVSNEDISNIKIGDQIKYHFHALPYKEYGELSGKITKISADSNVSEDLENSYYIVDADIENKPLHSYKGEIAEIKVGMSCDAQVITKTKRVLFYLLEKLDIWG